MGQPLEPQENSRQALPKIRGGDLTRRRKTGRTETTQTTQTLNPALRTKIRKTPLPGVIDNLMKGQCSTRTDTMVTNRIDPKLTHRLDRLLADGLTRHTVCSPMCGLPPAIIEPTVVH